MLPTMSRLITALTTVAVLTGCGLLVPPRACTDAGCESAVTFLLPVDLEVNVAYEVEACVDELCERATLAVPLPEDGPFTGVTVDAITLQTDTDSIMLSLGNREMADDHRVRVTVSIDDEAIAEGEADVAFERNQPNGPGCEPVCWFAEVEV